MKFELKQEHIDLLSKMNWSMKDDRITNMAVDDDGNHVPVLGDVNLAKGLLLVLKGRPEPDPETGEPMHIVKITDVETGMVIGDDVEDGMKGELMRIYSELPIALEVILTARSFELGVYKCKHYLRDWKKDSRN